MHVQPITYRGRVAACTAECFLLADHLAYRSPGDPELLFVVMMCAYASDVARDVLPGPYDNDDECRYARAVLVPDELLPDLQGLGISGAKEEAADARDSLHERGP